MDMSHFNSSFVPLQPSSLPEQIVRRSRASAQLHSTHAKVDLLMINIVKEKDGGRYVRTSILFMRKIGRTEQSSGLGNGVQERTGQEGGIYVQLLFYDTTYS